MFLFNIFVMSSCLALCLSQDFDNYDDYYDSRNSSSTSENKTTSYEEANATLIQINAADVAQVLQKIDDLENKIKTLTQNVTGLEGQVDVVKDDVRMVVTENANRKEEISRFQSIMNSMSQNEMRIFSKMSVFETKLQEDHDDIADVKNQLNENSKTISLIESNQQKDYAKIGRMVNHLQENSDSISFIISNQQKDHADIERMLDQFKAIHRELNRLTANLNRLFKFVNNN